jgi:hypothetical protein
MAIAGRFTQLLSLNSLPLRAGTSLPRVGGAFLGFRLGPPGSSGLLAG